LSQAFIEEMSRSYEHAFKIAVANRFRSYEHSYEHLYIIIYKKELININKRKAPRRVLVYFDFI